MKTFLFFLVLLPFSFAFSNEVEVKVDPLKPVMGETFRLRISLKTEEVGTPEVSFNPGRAKVLGRESSVEIQTSRSGNRFKSERKITYAYEMLYEQNGVYFIRDIEVVLKGKRKTHPAIRIHVLKVAKKKKAIFLRAEVKKKEFYLGEANEVYYYLYSKASSIRYEILEFPKLNNFLKSYTDVVDPDSRAETIEMNGEIYYRKLVYKGKVFAEKAGTLVIDPFSLRVQYYGGGRSSPFGNFGLSFSRSRTATVSSKPLKIQANALPADGVPPHFTGLVGKHKFNVLVPKNKFIVNEAIEVKLEVEGGGALEKYNGPIIYQDKNLENFDTNSELSINKSGPSKKVIEYTYLARGPIKIGKSQLPLSYFDPGTKRYITVKIDLPELSAIGGSGYVTKSNTGNSSGQEVLSPSVDGPVQAAGSNFVGPIYSFNAWYWRWFRILNIVLFIGVFAIFGRFYFFPWLKVRRPNEQELLLKKINGKTISYRDLYQVICQLGQRNGLDMSNAYQIIEESSLKEKNKQYLGHLLAKLEEGRYKTQEMPVERLKRSVYRDLKKCLI